MSAGLIAFERAKAAIRGFRFSPEQAQELVALIRAATTPAIPIVENASVPPGEIHFVQDGKITGLMTNVGGDK